MINRISSTVGQQLHSDLTAWAKDDGLSLSQLVLKLLSKAVALRKADTEKLVIELLNQAAAKQAIYDAIDVHDEIKRKDEELPIETLDQAAAKQAIYDAIKTHEDIININRFPFLRSK